MKTKLFTLIYFLFIVQLLYSQNENDHWYFGVNAVIDFSSGLPVGTNIGALSTQEGCATISNSTGQLLFYTDGSTVYDSTPFPGSIMTNGNGLLGNSTSASSAIIVPAPCLETQYYIFTVDWVNNNTGQIGNGINYSIVDMDDNGDCRHDPATEFGMVTPMKNIALPGPTGERIAATKHANDANYWVVATQHNSMNFYVYEITSSGVTPPSIQPVATTPRSGLGLMKFSPDGTRLALTDAISNNVYIYDFNSTTGIISSEQLLGTAVNIVYGVEFSPDGTFLFYSDRGLFGAPTGTIYQVNLSLPAPPVVIAVVPNIGGGYACGAMQLTPTQEILIVKEWGNFLDAITFPSGVPTYIPNAVAITGTGRLGLPTFVSGQVSRCKPLSMTAISPTLPDLRPAAPTLFSPAIKAELVTDGFQGMDKEYDDIDNDGDIDILFTKSNVLHYFENTGGYCNPPTYPNPSISLGISDCYSFRLYDWDNDGDNDLIIHGMQGGINGVFLYLNNGSGTFSTTLSPLLTERVMITPLPTPTFSGDFPFETQQLIEVGDLNNDNLPDILISNQGGGISGTVYFENTGTGFILPPPQNYNGIQIINPFIPEDGGSYPCPELYDADCVNGVDLLLSDPLTGPNGQNPTSFFGGGRIKFYENLGGVTSLTLPNFSTTGLINQFGFNDIDNNDLRCDWVITRIVDFYNDNCPIAMSYNPCNDEIFFYFQQNCVCSDQNFFVSTENPNEEEAFIRVFPNPSNDFISVIAESDITIQSFSIFSVEGKLIGTEEYKNQAISVNQLNPGVYFLNIQTNKGSISKKIITK